MIQRIRLISLHVGVEFAAKSGRQPLKNGKVTFPVLVIAQDEPALVAATDGVIKGAGKMHAGVFLPRRVFFIEYFK